MLISKSETNSNYRKGNVQNEDGREEKNSREKAQKARKKVKGKK